MLSALCQKIVNFVDESYTAYHAGQRMPSIGAGVGYAFGMLGLQLITSICINHYFLRSSATGVFLGGGLINAIYNRSLHLTTRARATLPNGKLVNHISTDISVCDTYVVSSRMTDRLPSGLTTPVVSSTSSGYVSLYSLSASFYL